VQIGLLQVPQRTLAIWQQYQVVFLVTFLGHLLLSRLRLEVLKYSAKIVPKYLTLLLPIQLPQVTMV